jgi:aspartyl-tRNA(Asn)/glutamyl-tRNA(Gln) amidotransferase subunit C
MPAGFTREQVLGVAALANLDLSPLEADLFRQQLANILAYADQVQRVDTTGVPPTAHVVTRHAADRPDEVKPCLDRSEALESAPEAGEGAFFKVPRVIG